jgi:hypothetical protein
MKGRYPPSIRVAGYVLSANVEQGFLQIQQPFFDKLEREVGDKRFGERRCLKDGRRIDTGAVVRTANAEVMFGTSRPRAKSGKRYARNLATGSRFRQKSVEVGHRFTHQQDFCRIVPAATPAKPSGMVRLGQLPPFDMATHIIHNLAAVFPSAGTGNGFQGHRCRLNKLADNVNDTYVHLGGSRSAASICGQKKPLDARDQIVDSQGYFASNERADTKHRQSAQESPLRADNSLAGKCPFTDILARS